MALNSGFTSYAEVADDEINQAEKHVAPEAFD
jgi:hypothetical protein